VPVQPPVSSSNDGVVGKVRERARNASENIRAGKVGNDRRRQEGRAMNVNHEGVCALVAWPGTMEKESHAAAMLQH